MSGDVAALRAVAEAATPGPWAWHFEGNAARPWWGVTNADGHRRIDVLTEADAEYVATANPATLLALLDRLERAEQKVARVEALADEWERTVYKLVPGYPLTVNKFCRHWFKDPLRAALDAAGHGETPRTRSGLTGRSGQPGGGSGVGEGDA